MEPLMTPDEVADYLAVPRRTLSEWRYRKTGPAGIRVGRHLRYRRSDVEAWVEELLQRAG